LIRLLSSLKSHQVTLWHNKERERERERESEWGKEGRAAYELSEIFRGNLSFLGGKSFGRLEKNWTAHLATWPNSKTAMWTSWVGNVRK
jgi:hypothetical protein